MKVKICDPDAFYEDQWTVVEEFYDPSMMDSILEFPTFPVYDGLLIKIHRAYSGVYMDGKFRNLCIRFYRKPCNGGKSWIDHWRDSQELTMMFIVMSRILSRACAVELALKFIFREIEYHSIRDISEECMMAMAELNAVATQKQTKINGDYFQPTLDRGFVNIFDSWLPRALCSAIYIANGNGNLEEFSYSFRVADSVRLTDTLRSMIPIRDLCKLLLNSNAPNPV